MKPFLAPLPPDLSWNQPAVLLATWFGCGRLPFEPGTWGSLGALPVALAALHSGAAFGIAASTAIFAVGVWSATLYVRSASAEDPPEVVIDEASGLCLSLCFAPLTPLGVAAAFLLFRVFDVCKPFPIDWIETHVPSGWGVMLDDAMAALYAGAVLLLLRHFGLL